MSSIDEKLKQRYRDMIGIGSIYSVSKNTILYNSATVNNNLNISNNTILYNLTINSNLNITGNMISNNLNTNNLYISGYSILNNTLINNILNVSSNTIITNNLSINSLLYSGNTYINSSLTLNNNLYVSNNSIFNIVTNNSTLYVNDNSNINNLYYFYNLPGLIYTVYSGDANDNVNFYKTAPILYTGTVLNMSNISTATNNNMNTNSQNFSVEWLGYFYAPLSGIYTFTSASDDGSYLWLGDIALNGYSTGNALINNGGYHGVNTVSNNINLNAGIYYPLRIQFFQGGGPNDLQFSFIPPNGSRIYDGTGYFFNNNINTSILNVSSNTFFLNNTTINSNLYISNQSILNNITINSNLYNNNSIINNNLTIQSSFYISGNTKCNNNIYISGTSNILSNLSVLNNTILNTSIINNNIICPLNEYDTNTDAAAGGIPYWGLYRTGGIVKIRLDIDTPLIILNGQSIINLYLGQQYIEYGVTVYDNLGENLVPIITGTVNTNNIGTYILLYNVIDSFGNYSNTLTRTINVYSNP